MTDSSDETRPRRGLTRQTNPDTRAAAVAGIAFSLLLTASFVLVRLAVPRDPEDAGRWLTEGGKRDAVIIALNLLPFAGIAFLWFIGVVRDRIGEAEDDSRDRVPGCGLCSSPCCSPPVPSPAGWC